MHLAVDSPPSHAKNQISAIEANDAIYIDFEGREKAPPVLLGIAYATGRPINVDKPVMLHYLLDPTFQHLMGACEVTEMYRNETRSTSLEEAIRQVILLARSRNRLIVSWSQHEREVVLDSHIDDTLREEFVNRYRDGKATAKRWWREFHPDVEFTPGRSGRKHTLANYFGLSGYELPDPTYGVGRTGKNLKIVRDALERHGSWDALHPGQRAKWIEVLNHNKHDCLGLREVVTRAATELES